jgi:hypothetical protein
MAMVTASRALAAVRLTTRGLSPPSPRRAVAMAASIVSLLAFARIACSVLEAYSQVRGERLADAELMQMCANNIGKGSADFRALCLRKRAEQASPVIFKALLRACSSAFQDFAESMSSPTKVLLLILFCFTGVAAPVVKAVSALFVDALKRRRRRYGRKAKDSDSDDSDNEDGHHEIVTVSSAPDPGLRWSRSLRRGVRRLRMRGPRALCEPSTFATDDEDDLCTIDLHDRRGRSMFSNTPACESERLNFGRGILR